ncbi:MAG: transposase zinc-binding domain-containing protein [Myxococcota bacterium]
MPQRVRHRPEDTVLYRVVRDHLDAFLREAREQHGGFPPFIEKTFRAYLDCGRPERGCIHLHCECCGHDDVVALSCKRRGVCPSCSARAQGDGAAHLVEHVLPDVPIRQWVVSFPFELGGVLAFQPELLVAVERMVMDALCSWQRARGGREERRRAGASQVWWRFEFERPRSCFASRRRVSPGRIRSAAL